MNRRRSTLSSAVYLKGHRSKAVALCSRRLEPSFLWQDGSAPFPSWRVGAADTSAIFVEALKAGLRENGLEEGRDYVLDLGWAEGKVMTDFQRSLKRW